MRLCDPNADGLVLVEQIYYAISIDSTSNKAHQHAAGARKDAPESDVKQHIGTSRGGQNTKVHALVNDELERVAFELTGGQVHDSKMAISLLEVANIAFVYFNADMAYGNKHRGHGAKFPKSLLLTTACRMQDLVFPTRDQTHTPSSGSMES